MRIMRLVIAALVIFCGTVTGTGPQENVYKINIRVFEIPPIQTLTQAGQDKNGNIVGTTQGGDVTVNFPARPVFIQTELGPASAEEEIKNILYDWKYLPRDCPPGGTSWSLAGSYSISCPERDLGMDSGRKEYHEPPIAPSKANHYVGRQEYYLTILPLSADSKEAALYLKFIGTREPAEHYKGSDKVLLDQKINVSVGKISIVCFPSFNMEERMSTPRGTVYVLAVFVQQQGS